MKLRLVAKIAKLEDPYYLEIILKKFDTPFTALSVRHFLNNLSLHLPGWSTWVNRPEDSEVKIYHSDAAVLEELKFIAERLIDFKYAVQSIKIKEVAEAPEITDEDKKILHGMGIKGKVNQ